jgi:Flp pilus assembly protein TadG
MSRTASRREREKGAVATIATILVASGVVMAMLALTVDVGNIMAERRQLQNGADAATLALARSCSKVPVPTACSSAAQASSAFESLAGANSVDGLQSLPSTDASSQPLICGRNVPTLPTCTLAASAANLDACLPLPRSLDASLPYVETRTQTKSTGASPNALTSFFAKAAMPGYTDKQYTACSRAAWGSPKDTGKTLPMTIGNCEWVTTTASGTKHAPSPAYTPAPGTSTTNLPANIKSGGYVVGIQSHADSNNVDEACRKANGQYYPGGFGWLTETNCVTTVNADATVTGDTGASVPDGGKSAANLQQYLGKEVYIPISVTATGTGTSGSYTMDGVASFFLAGYSSLPAGGSAAVYKDELNVCSAKCIWGWFTSSMMPVDSALGTTSGKGGIKVVSVG